MQEVTKTSLVHQILERLKHQRHSKKSTINNK